MPQGGGGRQQERADVSPGPRQGWAHSLWAGQRSLCHRDLCLCQTVVPPSPDLLFPVLATPAGAQKGDQGQVTLSSSPALLSDGGAAGHGPGPSQPRLSPGPEHPASSYRPSQCHALNQADFPASDRLLCGRLPGPLLAVLPGCQGSGAMPVLEQIPDNLPPLGPALNPPATSLFVLRDRFLGRYSTARLCLSS